MSETESVEIREVWSDNLEQEFKLIRESVDQFPYIAIDTEYPGVVHQPLNKFKNINDFSYHKLMLNVNNMKLIQLGLTLSDNNGNLPICGSGTGTEKPCIWQFNFKEFNMNEDKFMKDSIDLLEKSGIDFEKISEKGVDASRFGELLMSSGVVLNANVCMVTFHGGYDLGFLIKLLTGKELPESQIKFFNLLKIFFPMVYDVKHMIKFSNSLHGGLNRLANTLGVKRVGTSHQAGSDSLLTIRVFKKVKDCYLGGSIEKCAGVLHGLGVATEVQDK